MSALAQHSPRLPATMPLWPAHSKIAAWLSVAVLLLNVVDLGCTILWVRLGVAQEANPLLAPLLEQSEWGFATAKMAVVCAGLGFLWQHRDIALVRAGLGVCAAVYGSLGVYHLSIAGRVYELGLL